MEIVAGHTQPVKRGRATRTPGGIGKPDFTAYHGAVQPPVEVQKMKQIGVRMLSCLALVSFLFTATATSAGEPRVVLKGYDPVAYFTDAKPVKGDARYSYDWDDQRFHF